MINVTALTARQKVSGYVGDQISHLMGGDEPTLVLAQERLVWRVPVILTRPSQGVVGVVGAMDVDALTGSLIVQPGLLEQTQASAEAIM